MISRLHGYMIIEWGFLRAFPEMAVEVLAANCCTMYLWTLELLFMGNKRRHLSTVGINVSIDGDAKSTCSCASKFLGHDNCFIPIGLDKNFLYRPIGTGAGQVLYGSNLVSNRLALSTAHAELVARQRKR